MKILILLMLLALGATACTQQEKSLRDSRADETLNPEDAEETLSELREIQQMEDQRRLERQITDPLVETQ